jgi:Domain of unknown function (DUF4376)
MIIDVEGMPRDRANVIIDLWNEIKAYRRTRLMGGGFPVGTDWFHSDVDARNQYLTLARKADNIQANNGNMSAQMTSAIGKPIVFKTLSHTFVPVTATLAQSIVLKAEIQDMATYEAAEIHKALMSALPDPTGYDYTQGYWPIVFGETTA